MNRKYIDFVPTSKVGNTSKRTSTPQRRVVREVREESVVVAMPDSAGVVRSRGFRATTVRENRAPEPEPMYSVPESEPSSDDFSINNSLKLGVVEDYNPKFVNKDVPKRPLHHDTPRYATVADRTAVRQEQSDLAEIKAKKVKTGLMGRHKKTGIKSVEESAPVQPATGAAGAAQMRNVGGTYTPPRSPFINQEKVVKRPLSSKNVYQRAAPAPKEEAKSPVTIIEKPEKDSKMGLLVTIILTIILGAAAGTVAFLLLPR